MRVNRHVAGMCERRRRRLDTLFRDIIETSPRAAFSMKRHTAGTRT